MRKKSIVVFSLALVFADITASLSQPIQFEPPISVAPGNAQEMQLRRLANSAEARWDYESALNFYRQLQAMTNLSVDPKIYYEGELRCLLALKRLEEAEKLVSRRFNIAQPELLPDLHLDLCEIYLAMEQENKAESECEAGLFSPYANLNHFREVAGIFMRYRKLDKAVEVLKRAETKYGKANVNYDLASVYATVMDYKNATRYYIDFLVQDAGRYSIVERAICNFPEGEETTKMVSEEIGRSPGDKAVVTKLLSSFYVSRGKYKEALEIVLARDTDGRLLMDFVPSIKNEGTYDLASTAYKIAYERSKDDKLKLSALLGQAECWEGLGRYPEAIGAYKQIAEGYPTSMLAINSLLSIAKIYRGRFHSPDSAKIYLARLLSIIGQRSDLSPSALLELAKCEVMLGDVDSSLRCLPAKIPDAKAVFTDEQAQGLLLAGRCYFWKEEIDSAVAIWEKLARLKPMSDPANDALKDILLVKETKDTTLIKGFASAWFSAEQWKLPDAISAYQRIITKSLSSVIGGRSAMGIADCWVNLSLPDSALLSLDIYLESAPSAQLKDEILYQAGQICEKELGDAVKARGYYERLLLECPESPLGPRVRVGL